MSSSMRSRTSTKSSRILARSGLMGTASIELSDSPTWRHCWMTGRNCSGSRICLLREKRTWCPRARSTVEAFHNISMNLTEHVEKWTPVADLLASFKNQSNSDYLVVYLGLLTSATCSLRASSSSTSWKVGKLSRSSAIRKWKPCARRMTTSTSSH